MTEGWTSVHVSLKTTGDDSWQSFTSCMHESVIEGDCVVLHALLECLRPINQLSIRKIPGSQEARQYSALTNSFLN